MKEFKQTDIVEHTPDYPRIYMKHEDLLWSPPKWMGIYTETSTGYGKRLNTGYKISFEGRLYRVYASHFSNAASCWFKVMGRTIYVN